ncbi:MAG: CCA tRNA nucleotidyltransferase, partial [Phycisphaerae bacterium]
MNSPSAVAAAAGRIVRALKDAGHQALWAGGCVRDMLLGREPSDIDIATSATPEQIMALFKPTRKVGVQFGVVLVRKAGHWFEVATFRRDVNYADGRRPEQVVFTDAREDALRRDFTINGLFYDPITGQVIDYVGGQEDLRAGLVRAIGDPAQRFAEDHLRLLRAARFAARLGFQIEASTAEAVRAHAADLVRISPERIREELEKML